MHSAKTRHSEIKIDIFFLLSIFCFSLLTIIGKSGFKVSSFFIQDKFIQVINLLR